MRRILPPKAREERDGQVGVADGERSLGLVVERLGGIDVVGIGLLKGVEARDGLLVKLVGVELVGVGKGLLGAFGHALRIDRPGEEHNEEEKQMTVEYNHEGEKGGGNRGERHALS